MRVGLQTLPHLDLRVLLFFSSRRRHTRCSRDWSSDVCSSDLIFCVWCQQSRDTTDHNASSSWNNNATCAEDVSTLLAQHNPSAAGNPSGLPQLEIGRASCRERV